MMRSSPRPLLSCLASTTTPKIVALNLPRRLVAMADAFLGMVHINVLLLLLHV
jgi:hypothetical protein